MEVQPVHSTPSAAMSAQEKIPWELTRTILWGPTFPVDLAVLSLAPNVFCRRSTSLASSSREFLVSGLEGTGIQLRPPAATASPMARTDSTRCLGTVESSNCPGSGWLFGLFSPAMLSRSSSTSTGFRRRRRRRRVALHYHWDIALLMYRARTKNSNPNPPLWR